MAIPYSLKNSSFSSFSYKVILVLSKCQDFHMQRFTVIYFVFLSMKTYVYMFTYMLVCIFICLETRELPHNYSS